MAPQLLQHNDYTVGWICALWQEQTAAKAMLDCIHEDLPQPQSDKNTYTLGTIAKYNVVIACLPCGEATHAAAAAASSAWMVTTFPSIRFGLMVGIGGGIPPKVRLGDVVVSLPIDQFPGVVQWDVGTAQQDDFERTGSLNNPPTLLLRAVSKLRTDHDLEGSRIPEFLEELKTKWPDMTKGYLKPYYNGADCNHIKYNDQNMEEEKFCSFCNIEESLSREPRDMRIHYGLIASGNEVIEDALSRDKLNRNLGGNLLCVETEAAGLMNNFPCVVIRGICDYADWPRNKVWQRHAATVAAAFAKELLGYVQPYEVDREPPVWEIVGQALETSRTTEDKVTNLDRQEHFQVLEWITPLSFGPQQNDNLQKRLAGTGKWLLDSDKFRRWINGSNQTLFCPGIPGAGKTTLSAMVIDHLEKSFQGDTTIGLAYIYFNFRSDHKAGDLVKSLLKQLSQPFSALPDAVKGLYKRHKDKVPGPDYPEILETLQLVATMYSKLFLVVDALDECPTSDCCRDTFISEILALQAATGANIFATSRHVPEITEKFMGALSLEIRANDGDVRKYVEDHISDMEFPVDTGLSETIKTVIVEAVDGRFLLAQLYLQSLADTINPAQMKRTLNEFRDRHKRTGEEEKDDILYKAYNDAMIRINKQEPYCKKFAKRTISWISCAKRPLKTEELQVALAVKADDTPINQENYTPIEFMVYVCGGLVTVDEKSNIIRLVHHTTQEYLEQYLGDWVPAAQEDIATTCLRYLSSDVFDEDFCPSERSLRSKLDLNPFYDYAARNWGHHVRVAPKVDDRQVLKFLRNEAKVRGAHQAMYPSDYWIYDAYSEENQDDSRKVTGLHLAADFGLEKMTRLLLEEKRNPHLWDIFDMSPLCYAVRSGHKGVVSLLLATKGSCPNLNITDQRMVLSGTRESGEKASAEMPFVVSARYPEVRNSFLQQNILSLAAEYGHKEVVDVLIKAENIDLNSEYSPNPLLYAAGKGHVGVVELLLDADMKGIEPDKEDPVSERRPLSCAAERGHTKVVELLLATGKLDINSGDGYTKRSPLSWAAADSSAKDVLELLLTQDGIKPYATDREGRTPLSHAAERGNVSAVRALLSKGYFDGMDVDGRTPLTYAVINGQYTTAKLLLAELGTDPDSRDRYDRTPLSYAAQGGQEQIVNILLAKANVNPESRDENGRTPLSHAAKWGHEKIINILLAKDGVDADSSDKYGQTPLSHAVEAGQDKVVAMLLARNDVRPNSEHRNGQTPLSIAARVGNGRIVKMLLSRSGVDPDSRDKHGWTPLSYAAQRGREEIVIQLLANDGVDPNSRDDTGRTPLSWAAGNGMDAVVQLLLSTSRVHADIPDSDGRTPLSWAAGSGHAQSFKLLLANKSVDACSLDMSGRSAFSWVAKGQYRNVTNTRLSGEYVRVNTLTKQGKEIAETLLATHGIESNLWATSSEMPSNDTCRAENWHELVVRLLLTEDGAFCSQERDQTQHATVEQDWRRTMTALYLERGAIDPNFSDDDGRTLLWWAAQEGFQDVVQLLVAQGNVDAHASDWRGRTPLHRASERGHEGVVKLLLANDKVDVNSWDSGGRTPLSRAAKHGHVTVVKLLLAQEALKPGWMQNRGEVPLVVAAAEGHEGIVRLLLDKSSAHLNVMSLYGATLLSEAARNGHYEIVKLLLAKNAVASDSEDYSKPLIGAASNGHAQVVRLLLDNEAGRPDDKQTNMANLLWESASRGHTAVVELLLAKDGVELDAQNSQGETALHAAALNGHSEVVKLLLARDGLKINLKDKEGRTPLICAIAERYEEVVELLWTAECQTGIYSEESST
ncbi:hypothetical protein MHUMG1_09428 [Metarhizium humberi]|uniref:NACHT domain-containing protein n=1 Tax=Metarhizium humberi TaxID=2596975 RepID=A0A9P8M2L5_9HYPO|nr:hypothetical protein MHUMG1_09428 [Metarhizium humberi]